MIPKELLSKLSNMDSKEKNQAENIWKMLDEMQESNPEAYKNFV